jgi:hypothetical protein
MHRRAPQESYSSRSLTLTATSCMILKGEKHGESSRPAFSTVHKSIITEALVVWKVMLFRAPRPDVNLASNLISMCRRLTTAEGARQAKGGLRQRMLRLLLLLLCLGKACSIPWHCMLVPHEATRWPL